jgi:hypothetical protein
MDGKALDFPDPFIFRASDGTYYAYGTGSVFFTLQVASSPDGINWHWVGDPFGTSGWANLAGHTWAPAVLERPGNPSSSRFVMYYTSRSEGLNTQCIGRATSSSPTGPFNDANTAPLVCQTNEVWSLDASPFVALDGTASLVWATGNPTRTARLWSQRLDPSGLGFAAGTSATNIFTYASGTWEDPVVEGPTMLPDAFGFGFWLFYSGNSWPTANYATGVAWCGFGAPCTRVYTTPLLASRGSMVGTGGGTPFVDAVGNWNFAFHAWESPNVGYDNNGKRMLRILPITWPQGRPKIG